MRKTILIVALAAFLFDPLGACFGGPRAFEYSAADMRAAVEGTWLLVVDQPG